MTRKILDQRSKEEFETINIKSIESKLDRYIEKKVVELTESLSSKIDNQIEYKSNKFFKEEEKRITRKTRFKIFRLNVLIIVLLAIVCYFGYCLYDIDYFHIKTVVVEAPKENVTPVESTDENTLSTEEENNQISKETLISNYSYLIESLIIDDEAIFELFNEDIDADELSNELKLKIAYKNLDSALVKRENGVISFDSIDLEDSFKKVFGDRASLKNEKFSYNSLRFMLHKDEFLGLEEEYVDVKLVYQIADVILEDDLIKIDLTFSKIDDENSKQEYVVTFENIDNNYKFARIEKKD